MDGKNKVSLWAAAAGSNLLAQYKFKFEKLYFLQVDILFSSPRLFRTFHLNEMEIRYEFLKTAYIVWDYLVGCCITRSLLHSYWFNLFVKYLFYIDIFNIFIRLFRTSYLNEIWIRYEFLKTRYIVWYFLNHYCITGSLLYFSWLNLLIIFFKNKPC